MERFSYYGMRAILVLYLVAATTDGGVGLTRENALSIYATYTGLVYLTPLIGGFLADKFLGARKAIFIGGLVMMYGEMLMMFPETLYYGLAFLILGNGFFKPNISTIVGNLYEDNDPRRDGAFTIFYMGINVGAFFSPLVCGTLADHFGWKVGFAGAAIGMAIGVIIFLLGQKSFGKAGFPPSREYVDENSRLLGRDWLDILWLTAAVCAVAAGCVLALEPFSKVWGAIPEAVKAFLGVIILVGAITGLFGMAYKGGLKENKAKAVSDSKAVAAILVISLFVIFFWLGFEQAGGTMTLFAEEQTNRNIFGWEMPASYFQSVNPIFIVLLAPLFSMMWTKIDGNPKTRLSVVYKMCASVAATMENH
jgi:POT family proton-dependent oligopeptide transporter